MIDILKIIVLPILMMFTSSKQKLMNSIDPKWHTYLVNYYFNSIIYLTVPLHEDAYALLESAYHENDIRLNDIIKNVYVFNEGICDILITHEWFDLPHMYHNIYTKHEVPASKQYELVTRFEIMINYIANMDEDLIHHHRFIHVL